MFILCYVSFILCVQAQDGEPIGQYEQSSMKTTLKTIQKMHREGIVDVNPAYRIRDNFNRIHKQACWLEKRKKTEQDITYTLDEGVHQFIRCAERQMKHYARTQENIADKDVLINTCYEPLRKLFSTSTTPHQRYEGFPPDKEAKTNNIGETPGLAERMNAMQVFKRLKELRREGILDVSENIRIRDNLHRARNQFLQLDSQIKKIVLMRDYQGTFRKCAEVQLRKGDNFLPFNILEPCIEAYHAHFDPSLLK